MAKHNRGASLKDLPIPPNDKQRDYLLSAYKNIMSLLDYAWQDGDLAVCQQRFADCATNLREAYREGVPFVEISRCPISGEVLRHSLDFYGLDGLWWNNRNPIRPMEERSRTLLAFTGAMMLNKKVEFTNFLVKPGPGVPFVIPRLLSHDRVQAVMSSVMVGRHVGFVIAYFSGKIPVDIQHANDWGQEYYQVVRDDGEIGWDKADNIEADYDFELKHWIEQGKLHWISPGDSQLNLHDSVNDCPYIDLEGLREIQRVKEGEIWYPSLIEKRDARTQTLD